MACLLKYKAGSQTCSATLRTTLRSRYTAFRSGRITNTAYTVRGSARPSPIFSLPLVAKTSHTLERTSVALKYPINIAVPGHGLQNFVDQTRKAAYL